MHTRHERTIASPMVRKVVAAATAMLLFGPGIAWITGSRGRPADNKAPIAFAGLDRGWSSLTAFGAFLADRLPLRSSAIRTDGWIDQRVFREDPAFGGSATPDVMRGRHDQLFFREDFSRACRPASSAVATAGALSRIATLVQESGRDVVTIVPPDKSTVLTDDLPDAFPERECWTPYHDELWSALDSASIAGWLDVRSLLEQRRSATGHPLYLPLDSHWDSEGSLIAVRAMVEALTPGLFDEAEIVDTGMVDYTGDLTLMTGDAQSALTAVLEVHRADVARVSSVEVDKDVSRWVNAGEPGRLVPGRTVILGDSFAVRAMNQILPYFQDLTFVSIYANDPSVFTTAIQDADHVVIMIVERNLSFAISGTLGPAFVDQLTATLAG